MKRLLIGGALAASLCAPAHALFFFFIPGGMISGIADKVSGVEGDHCVAESAKVGDMISLPGGQAALVKSLSGTSSRCTGPYPIRARLEVQLSEAMRSQEHSTCVSRGVKVGDRITVLGLGEVEVKRFTSATQCGGDLNKPLEAMVMSTQAAKKEAVYVPVPVDPNWQPVKTSAPTPLPAPAAAPAPSTMPAQSRTAFDRLRELKQMRDENLITQEVYEAKQRDILQSQ